MLLLLLQPPLLLHGAVLPREAQQRSSTSKTSGVFGGILGGEPSSP